MAVNDNGIKNKWKKSIKTMDFFLFTWYNEATFKFGKEKEEISKSANNERWFLKIITKY